MLAFLYSDAPSMGTVGAVVFTVLAVCGLVILAAKGWRAKHNPTYPGTQSSAGERLLRLHISDPAPPPAK
jgi:hypothetical protein